MNFSKNELPSKDCTSLFLVYGEAGKCVLEFQANFSEVFEVFSSNNRSNWTSSFPTLTSHLHSTVLQMDQPLRDNCSKQLLGALRSHKNTTKHTRLAFSDLTLIFVGS